ncbi:MAG: anti-sigma factor [Roseivirga sp.]|nr:anti-sigma factor [Roseivirga sp.]
MDIKDYIASGILEAYALDDLPQEERAAVETMLDKHPELREELNAIEEGLEALAMETAIAPPSGLKDNLFAALDKEHTQEVEETQPETKVIPLAPKKSYLWNYVAAASISIALVSSFMAQDFYSRWKQSQAAYADVINSNELLANQNNKVNRLLDQKEKDFAVLANPDFGRVDMASVIEGQSFAASVYWNKKTEEAYLSIQNLSNLTEEQQFQLWAIVDGKPVSMGVFDLEKDVLTKMSSIANAGMFAVTIEPRGGSVNPTMDAMQVAGEVG